MRDKNDKVVNRKVCGNGHLVGYSDIHIKLHQLFWTMPRLRTESNNVIVNVFWTNFDGLTELMVLPNWPWYTSELTSLQRIDREIRNILQPSQHRQKSREAESEVRAKYATGDSTSQL